MRVRITKDADLPTHVLVKGSEFEVSDDYAKEWIALGVAEPATEKKRTATKKMTRETRDET